MQSFGFHFWYSSMLVALHSQTNSGSGSVHWRETRKLLHRPGKGCWPALSRVLTFILRLGLIVAWKMSMTISIYKSTQPKPLKAIMNLTTSASQKILWHLKIVVFLPEHRRWDKKNSLDLQLLARRQSSLIFSYGSPRRATPVDCYW